MRQMLKAGSCLFLEQKAAAVPVNRIATAGYGRGWLKFTQTWCQRRPGRRAAAGRRQVTQAIRSKLVAPGVPNGRPAVTTMLSPGLAKPSARA